FFFNVFCFDGDSNDSLTMVSDSGIAGALFTIQGNLRPTGVFSWTPTLADVSAQPHVLTITVYDQYCPTQGAAVSYFSIYVTNDSINQSGFDFGINSSNPENGLNVSIGAGLPRCNSSTLYQLSYENTGSTMLNGRIIFIIDDSTSFNASYPFPPDLISGDSL